MCTNKELNMQLDYFRFMFNVHSFDTFEGQFKVNNWLSMVINTFNLVATAYHVEADVVAAYDMMLATVEDYIEESSYFSIEFKSKFKSYDFNLETAEKPEINSKSRWKQFFSETYVEL
jgi:hypothetical protein